MNRKTLTVTLSIRIKRPRPMIFRNNNNNKIKVTRRFTRASESSSNRRLTHRRPKLTMRGVFFFFNLYTNVEGAKRDTVTADIYYYITTEFGLRENVDLRLAVCGGVVLQRF